MKYRLSLDLGTNSIGWCTYQLEKQGRPVSITNAGVRIFSEGREPKSKTSLAVGRRDARSSRRRRDRYLGRRRALLKALRGSGLLPKDQGAARALTVLDPFELRATALGKPLPLHHVGRALFHLNQRRGFKSNRKTDRKDSDQGKIAIGVKRLNEAMDEAEARTFGEFLHMRRQKAKAGNQIPPVRTRLRQERGEGAKGDGYDYYPDRATLEDEFHKLWSAQAAHHAELTDALKDEIHRIMFYQRPLKKPKVGRCTFFEEERLAKAHPLFQERRLYEEVNALEIVRTGEPSRKLTLEERDTLILALRSKKSMAYTSMRKTIKARGSHFNKETDTRSKMLGDEVYAELSHKNRFGNRWAQFDTDRQWEIIHKLLEEENEDNLLHWLQNEFSLDAETALNIANANLPEGYGRIGLTATKAILEELKKDVVVYSDAVARAGERYPELKHHSDFRTGEIHNELPYYGEILTRHVPPGTQDPKDEDHVRHGRITNPTVHIALGQVRRVINDLIKTYGHPDQIVVEVARDLKMNEEQKKEVNTRNKKNREAAERRGKKLEELGISNTGANRARLKLWEELNPENAADRRCIYSDQVIPIEKLFTEAVDVDHILPFSRTLDDGQANRLVCLAEANKQKRNQTPWEAFGQKGSKSASWERIAELATRLTRNKRWRFQPDAMQKFEEEDGFLARHLTDTQYLSRMAKQYLEAVCDPNQVWVIPGRMTEMLRRHWGLNTLLPDHNYVEANQPKNRLDHRHHAIDAAVIGVTDRALLNRISRASGILEDKGLDDVIGRIDSPWKDQGRDFRAELGEVVNRIKVSHRPDHGTISFAGRKKGKDQTAGQLHNDTAYGLTEETDAKGKSRVVRRVPIDTLTKAKDLEDIRDNHLRMALETVTAGKSGAAFKQAVSDFTERDDHQWSNLRRVRVMETLKTIPIRDKKGRPYKSYKGDANYRYDVWELPNGKYKAEVITMFEAHQPEYESPIKKEYPTARKIFRLHQDDMLALENDDGNTVLMVIAKFAASGQMHVYPHNESNADARNRDKEDPFSFMSVSAGSLIKRKARQVRIDSLGRVFDPGPRVKEKH